MDHRETRDCNWPIEHNSFSMGLGKVPMVLVVPVTGCLLSPSSSSASSRSESNSLTEPYCTPVNRYLLFTRASIIQPSNPICRALWTTVECMRGGSCAFPLTAEMRHVQRTSTSSSSYRLFPFSPLCLGTTFALRQEEHVRNYRNIHTFAWVISPNISISKPYVVIEL